MPKTTVITGGTIVTDYGEFRADLIMKGEEIAGIVSDASDIDHADQIDATGLLVMPGGIDPHTHFREPEEFTKEGFATGGAGAAAGGITTVIEMPQADPTTVTMIPRARASAIRRRATDEAQWQIWTQQLVSWANSNAVLTAAASTMGGTESACASGSVRPCLRTRSIPARTMPSFSACSP